MTVAIVSTQRTWKKESEPWARYHLSLGFSKIYVFCDDGRTDCKPSSSAVELIPCSKEYWDRHSPKSWQQYVDDVRREHGGPLFGSPESLTKRQVLNANAGFALAARDGIDWVLHIDDDEYFWCPDTSADAHFDGLQRAGTNYAVYLNHEAALFGDETPAEVKQRTCFKKNWMGLWDSQRNSIATVLPHKPYFSCYANGKAAARVLAEDIVVPNGAHTIWINDPMLAKAEFCRPGILHRPFKNAAQFCDKYLAQGTFSTETMAGMPWNVPEVQAKAQQLVRVNDVAGLRMLFEQLVTVSEAERVILEREGFLLTPDAPLPCDDEWHAEELLEHEAQAREVVMA
jgi:hypothetical protein